MDYTKLGNTGLEVSRICLGCMSYGDDSWQGWILDENAAKDHFKTALDAGINFFDTADMYSRGRSEEITGRCLRDNIRRDELVLATKVFFPLRDEGANRGGLSRKRIHDSCDASLKRLGMDYIDLYQIHRWDPHTPIEETMEALDSLVRAGKVRYLGASSMAAWQFAKAVYTSRGNGWHPFVSMQNHYNLVYREEEREMIPFCMDQGIATLPWSPLARGFLTGGRSKETPEPTKRAKTDAYGKRLYYTDADFQVAGAVEKVAAVRKVKPAQVALAWILQRPGVTAPIIGTTKVEHIVQAVDSISLRLDPEEMQTLEAPYVPHKVLGHTQPAPGGEKQ